LPSSARLVMVCTTSSLGLRLTMSTCKQG
jgi:hypothetical protein